MRGNYVPDAGHLCWLDFDPLVGHEQAGRRPALVLSPRIYNEAAGLALVCPVTRQRKGYPLEVALPEALTIGGVVLADQVRSVDWAARRIEYAAEAPVSVLTEVREKLRPLMGY